MALFRIIVS